MILAAMTPHITVPLSTQVYKMRAWLWVMGHGSCLKILKDLFMGSNGLVN